MMISPLNFTEKQLPGCDTTSCPEITVNYVEITENSDRARQINSAINNFIIEALYLGDETSEPGAKDISDAATQFVKMYRTHSAEFPDMQLEYFVEVNIAETYKTDDILSLEMHQYLFTGGAHGYGATFFATFDAQTGDEIGVEDLFSDFIGFKKFAETEFRRANKIPEGESINATGFWFENDTFYLPEAIGIRDSKLALIYNQYDIASYAAGPIELEIPLSKLKPYLSISIQ
ncbi:MAG: DUF3298 and DUF4163 domain-containing protein [Flavobacteriaceae bacterium]|nr:DUF3298 and DUF4163 domain-containing protein [Flavobacteriaceae bacterium]